MQLEVARSYAGPPNMGHGGYVAGLLVTHLGGEGPAQITLRRPIPLDTPLELDATGGGDGERVELRHGDDVIAEGERLAAPLDLDVPPPPSFDEARAAEADSPSHYDGRGVHPICFGCGAQREHRDGLRIFAGPLTVDGQEQVAGIWRPDDDVGTDPTTLTVAALDCAGAFAFIARGTRAGLLGRIVVDLPASTTVRPGDEVLVTGWQVGIDGRKMFAGTALFDDGGTLLASAKATWFGPPSAR